MKKNLFKKLSFVLALAMIISVITPAGAFAATKAPKLNSTKKYLHLDVDGSNDYNFNIKNKEAGWKYQWESSNEQVAEVNAKNGVAIATGVGTAKITVFITDKKGEEVDDLTATVVVRDNIETVKIANLPTDNKLAVGQENDFNRDFVTVSGSTKKTSAVTRWTVEPAAGATIADNGVFVATEAGEYTITANSFQSKAKYASWGTDAAKYADYLLASDTYKVTVSASMAKVEQVDLNKFKVTFDAPVVKADVDKNLRLSYLAGTTAVNHTIKEVKMDADSKEATVEVYSKFVEGSTYTVAYTDMTSVQFVAATTKVADVVRAEVLTKTAQVAVADDVKIALYNANNVNIANDDLLGRVEIKSSNNATYADSANKKLSMYKVGDVTTLTAVFHTYEWDLTTGLEKGAITVTGEITCVEKSTASTGILNAYTVVASNPSFGDAKHSVLAGTTPLYLYVELKGKEANGWQDKFTYNTPLVSNGFKFTTANSDVVIVGETSGTIYPVREGSAAIVVTYNDVVVGSAVITVLGAQKVVKVNLDNNVIVLSNHAQVLDNQTVKIEVKDQLDGDYKLPADTDKFEIETTLNGTVDDGTLLDDTTAKTLTPKFNAVGVAEGTYTYTVTVTDKANGYAKTYRYLTVQVKKPSSNEVYRYAIETSKSEYDMKINTWETWANSWKEDITISLFGYAANGVRNQRVNIANDGYTVNVKDAWNNNHASTGTGLAGFSGNLSASGDDAVLALVTTADNASGEAIISTMPTGTYILSAVNASGDSVNTTYFTVANTQPVPTVKVNKLYTDKTSIFEAINDCFDFSIGGTGYDCRTDYVVSGDTGKTIFVDKVYVYQQFGGVYVKHEVAVKTVINYAQ